MSRNLGQPCTIFVTACCAGTRDPLASAADLVVLGPGQFAAIVAAMKRTVAGTASAFGCEGEVEITPGYAGAPRPTARARASHGASVPWRRR
jgi:hypothetical protein